MPVIIDGTAGITFPVTAGSASAVQASSGRILQVVNLTYSTQISYTSTTFASTAVTLSITPSSTSSKILILANIAGMYSTASVYNIMTIYRNSATNLGSSTHGFGSIYGNSGDREGTLSCSYLDSPATTSSTTYTVYTRVTSATGYINLNTEYTTLVLMEVSA